MSKNIVVGADQTPSPEEILRRLNRWEGQQREIRSQLMRGSLTNAQIQALIEHLNPFSSGILTVDYSIKPSLVNMKIKAHPSRTDVVRIDMAKVERVLTLKEGESLITGHENRTRLQALEGKVQLDFRVLEELLKHPHLIPEEWKQGVTYFWGTIFRSSDDGLCVACLYWLGGGWRLGYDRLGSRWGASEPAACLESDLLLAA